jgi:hypothetical protein
MQIFFIFILSTITVLAYSDRDMDGVEDRDDMCPDTLLTELVDLTGCTVKNLVSPHHFDIVLGESYTWDDTLSIKSSSLQLDYYYKDFSLQLFSSYFDLEGDGFSDSGQNNSYLNGFYNIDINDDFLIRFRTGLSFPTYNDVQNRTDYTLSLYGRYQQENIKLFGAVGYSLIGDKEDNGSRSINKRILFYNLGLGYNIRDTFYGSLAYNYSEPLFNSSADIETLSLYGYYSFNLHWFATVDYKYGLSKTAMRERIGLKLGYYW